MRLGYLTSTDEDLLKKYPNISLEYRYLKSNKLNDKMIRIMLYFFVQEMAPVASFDGKIFFGRQG